MREIKFRAWTGNHWINEGMLYEWQESIYVESIGFDTESVPVMQYTGLKDRLGKEIYEGDIVADELSDDQLLFEIAFKDGSFKGIPTPGNGSLWYLDPSLFCKYISIGNIHENPQLINQ